MKTYYNYHKHTHYSNLFTIDSNTKPKEYIARCIELGQQWYSTCEHGSTGSIFEARDLCDVNNLKCLSVGEYYIVPDASDKTDKRNFHIVIGARTNHGRKVMNYISSHANADGYYYKPRLFLNDLLTLLTPKDVYITTACCAGLLCTEDSEKLIFEPLYKHFGDSLYLEVQNHKADIQKNVNKRVLELHRKYGLKIVAANDSHYIDDKGRKERGVLLAGKGMKYDDEDTFILDFPDYDTMFHRFEEQGVLSESEIEEAIDNTLELTECESIDIDHSIKMPTIYPELSLDERVDELKKHINNNFKKIVKEEHYTKEDIQRYKKEINYEMKVIEETNDEIHSADYFLFDEAMVDIAVNKYGGVLTRTGRGSNGSYLINKYLNLTQLDRTKFNLPIYPDRFMSTARLLENHSLPDEDLNVVAQEPFVHAMRDLLGEHSCYPMYAPGTMKESEAFRNLCRSKGLDYDEYNEIAKNIDAYRDDEYWKPIIEEAQNYVDTIVSGSVHPCSFTVDNKDLRYEYGLLRFGDYLCTPMTSSESDAWKILKNDVLVVKVWLLISETFKKIGKPIISIKELLNIIKDNDRIWGLYSKGLCATLNQTDGTWATNLVKQYKPKSVEELAMFVAALRPSFETFRDKFIKREEYSTGSSTIDELFSSTDSFILYQENLMLFFQQFGISPSQSIGLIKKISKKKIKQTDFDSITNILKTNWIKQVGTDDGFDETWDLMQSSMKYSFNSPHGLATALDSLYGAYLKAYYPYEYYTTCFDVYSDDQDETMALTNELPYFGIDLKPIKFRHSTAGYSFDKESHSIYKGIGSIKYLNNQIADELYALRDNEYATFLDALLDITATSIDTRQLTILIKIGFFEEFGEPNTLLRQYELYQQIMKRKTYKKSEIESGKCTIPEYLIAAHAGKVTDKQYSQIDQTALLKDVVEHTELPKTTVFDRMDYELEVLDYITTTVPDYNPRFCYVINIDGKFKKKYVTFYQIRTGKTTTRKCEIKSPIKIGDIVRIDEISNKRKWRKTGVDKDGKPTFEQLDETEPVVTGYSVTRHANST